MIKTVNSMGLFGIDAYAVQVQTEVARDSRGFFLVGLPDASVREARERVQTAIINSGFDYPTSKVTINLAPADVKKTGSLYDLPILISILMGSKYNWFEIDDAVFIGEVTLGGRLRPVNGILPMVISAKKLGFKRFFLPAGNAAEAAVVEGIDIYPVENITKLVLFLRSGEGITPAEHYIPQPKDFNYPFDFSEVKGQSMAKRALEISACGGHNILLIGSPGSGKSMLAKRLPSILPDMTFDEMIETTQLHSLAGLLGEDALKTLRPFRAPHHSVSAAGLSGGGAIPHPGEISLAHNGILFLDELPEFNRAALEVLRQPLEDNEVTISRVNASLTYPCSFTLVAAMNPCPCGYFGHPVRPCTCSKQAVSHYLSKISGPLLDRLDLHVEVPPADFTSLSTVGQEESSEEIKKRVNKVRKIQVERYKGSKVTCNSHMTPGMIEQFCILDDEAKNILENSFNNLGLSGRAYSRIMKVARTIADMDDSEVIKKRHILESIQYRNLDRKYWNK